MKEHKKVTGNINLPTRKYTYRFNEMEVGDVFSVPCKHGERDAKFHACRTRCAQVSVDGKLFRAYADNHSVYYKRES